MASLIAGMGPLRVPEQTLIAYPAIAIIHGAGTNGSPDEIEPRRGADQATGAADADVSGDPAGAGAGAL